MKWVEARVVFESSDTDAATALVSDIFYDFNLQGVVIETPEVETGVDWAENAIQTTDDNAVIGYFPKNDQLAERCRTLEEKLTRLEKSLDITITYRVLYHDIDEQDWVESWKQYFFTEKITDTIVINPSWRDYTPNPGEMVIEIDPGMAFGTGTHPTTRMCIALIEEWITPGDLFLDVGTGSGILMIAAAKLGAANMLGIDMDETAVLIAKQNLLKNKITPDQFKVKTGNLLSDVKGRFSLITANILSEVIMKLLDDIHLVLQKNGILICSGIIESKQKMIEEKLLAQGFEIIKVQIKDEWVAIAARLNP